MKDFVAIGKISGAVGLKGEVKVARWSDSLERFGLLKKVWIGVDEADTQEVVVDGVRLSGGVPILKLNGIDSRSAAEQLKEKLVWIPAIDVVQPPEGSYFIDDVMGMEVVTEEGKRVGIISDILQLPSNDLWQVDSGTRMISIPAVKEFVRKVDLQGRKVVIHEVEGLLDL